MRRARAVGYQVNLVYVGLRNADLSARRVAERVRQRGHGVPKSDICRRYDWSLAHLGEALRIAHRAWVIDNSGEGRHLLLSVDQDRVKHLTRQWPAWAKRAIPEALHQARLRR